MNNLDKVAQLFPECITETADDDGNLILAVDFDRLKQCLSNEIIDGREFYQFNFVGKKRATRDAAAAIRKTLRPNRAQSRDFDSTQNLYIEGDNLDALKLLRATYRGKVKLIYIDPPYNTGNDFIYRDDFKLDADAYDKAAGTLDDQGNRVRSTANTQSNPRFHSDWCAMIFSRLLLAKELLADDGVIFISIDDNEQAALKLICDEIFGNSNFVSNVIWEKKFSPQNDARWLSDSHDFILIYAKKKLIWRPNLLPRTEEMDARYKNPDNDPRGPWMSSDFTAKTYSPSGDYKITTPSGRIVSPPTTRAWISNEETFKKLVSDNRIWFGEKGNNVPRIKRFLSEVQGGLVSKTIWLRDDVGDNQDSKRELQELEINFDTPKPTRLIKKILQLATDADSIVLDFFSGSATTAHAVMELNAQDGGRRKFIMIQLPEVTPENSEARRAGYETICDIGKERIRRAGDKLKADHPELDVGFRVLSVDTSNFIDPPEKLTPQTILAFAQNIREDRDAWDLLFGTLLEKGLPITGAVASEELDGFQVLSCADDLLACFDKNLPFEFFRKLASRKPQRIIFRDTSFATSQDKINALKFFEENAPNTEVIVL